jgi:dienelactone hydrolase
MTRRQLAKLAAIGAAFQAKAASTYTGPLNGYEDKVKLADLDPIAFTKQLYADAPLQLTFKARTRKEAEDWQRNLHAKMVELLGGFPSTRTALQPRTLEVREFPTYRREKLVFQTRPGMLMVAYLILPKAAKAPVASVICIPGHGRGVDDLVGIDLEGNPRTDKPPYEHDFALQVAEAGMAAVAIEPLGFGARRDPANKAKGLAQKACEPAAGAALLLGQTILGWRVWDIMRTIDWIETRPELDSKRVGTMGISGGGTASLFSAALDPRVKAAMVSCYLNTFRDSIMSVAHCIDNYVPGILNWAEMYDVAGLIAPRAFFSEAGQRDKIFPLAASQESFRRVQQVYEVFGAANMAEQKTYDIPHEFSGIDGIPFMARHLAAGA